MQKKKQDYLFIVAEDGRPRYVNGQEISNWKEGPTMLVAMCHLIGKGWELVSDLSGLSLGHTLTFIRPKN